MFETSARIKIREGELDGFKQQAREVMRLTRESETQPLRYDWFFSDDGTECEVREVFVDADTLVAHQRHIAEAKMTLFRDFAAGHNMTLYGEPSPALAGALQAMAVPYKQFSLFQGLETEVKILDGVPA